MMKEESKDNDIKNIDKIEFNVPSGDTGDSITSTEPITIDSSKIEFTVNEEKTDPVGKPFKWKGIDFPAWAQGPHFIELKGSFVLAIDPNCVTMEMKTNWVQKYVPILVQLGKKVLEKLLKEEIRSI